MRDHSRDNRALIKIPHEWAEARMKGDSSYSASGGGALHEWKVVAPQITPVLEKRLMAAIDKRS